MSKARAAMVAVGLVGCLLTAGCTPPPLGMVGVVLDGGQPAALIRSCPGIAVNHVSVYERTSNLIWGAVDGGHHAVTEVVLLRTPAGWGQADVSVAKRLTGFSPDGVYQLQVGTDHAERGGIDMVEFTLRDISAGDVWASPPHGRPQVMTRDQFEQQAGGDC